VKLTSGLAPALRESLALRIHGALVSAVGTDVSV
jgi:hypothetical protein